MFGAHRASMVWYLGFGFWQFGLWESQDLGFKV